MSCFVVVKQRRLPSSNPGIRIFPSCSMRIARRPLTYVTMILFCHHKYPLQMEYFYHLRVAIAGVSCFRQRTTAPWRRTAAITGAFQFNIVFPVVNIGATDFEYGERALVTCWRSTVLFRVKPSALLLAPGGQPGQITSTGRQPPLWHDHHRYWWIWRLLSLLAVRPDSVPHGDSPNWRNRRYNSIIFGFI